MDYYKNLKTKFIKFEVDNMYDNLDPIDDRLNEFSKRFQILSTTLLNNGDILVEFLDETPYVNKTVDAILESVTEYIEKNIDLDDNCWYKSETVRERLNNLKENIPNLIALHRVNG